MDIAELIINLAANVLESLAALIAIYLFVFKRKEISKVFNLLLNYSHQLSLSELKEKLERLNDYNVNEPTDCEKIINIFHEIIGQIRGNENLLTHFGEIPERIEKLIDDKKRFNEPRKRAMVAELREKLRNLNARNLDSIIGGDK